MRLLDTQKINYESGDSTHSGVIKHEKNSGNYNFEIFEVFV